MSQHDDLAIVNRSVITIIPRQPFFAWVNALDPENIITPEIFKERTAYLITDDNNLEAAVKKHFAIIFENELNGMWTDPTDWPQKRTFKMFQEWFEWHIGMLLFDLDKSPIEKLSLSEEPE